MDTSHYFNASAGSDDLIIAAVIIANTIEQVAGVCEDASAIQFYIWELKLGIPEPG